MSGTKGHKAAIFDFFSAPGGARGDALLNWTGQPVRDLTAYAWSYRSAAMNLIAFREQSGVFHVDSGALPIVFLYRHALELYLKAIVYRAAVLTINEDELKRALPRLWREHSLVRLLKMAEPALRSPIRPLSAFGVYEKTLELASKIDEVDAGSYSFRYPVTSTGESSLPQNTRLNIFTFSDAMETVLDDVQQFCGSLENEGLQTSEQMKLALHAISKP